MKKLIAILIVTALALLGTWLWIYGSYFDAQLRIVDTYQSGDWTGAMAKVNEYRSGKASYLMYHLPFMEKFRLRLRYNEGVIRRKLGDTVASGLAFRDAALSPEVDIAAASLYNLALLSVKRGDMESAREHLSSALRLVPSDTEAKVNLELVLKRIRVLEMESRGTSDQRKEGRAPAEQWRDMPSYEEGQSNPESRRSYL